jgi:hypothetical protein
MWRGKSQSGVASLWDEMISTDLCETLPEVNVPVYFMEGVYDYTVNPTLAKDYFEKLRAPVKGFYTFDHF